VAALSVAEQARSSSACGSSLRRMRIALVHKRYDRSARRGRLLRALVPVSPRVGHDVPLVVGECRVRRSRRARAPVRSSAPGSSRRYCDRGVRPPRVWRAIDFPTSSFASAVPSATTSFAPSGRLPSPIPRAPCREDGRLAALRRAASPYQRAPPRLERRQYAPGGYRRFLTVSERTRAEILATYPHVPAAARRRRRYGRRRGAFSSGAAASARARRVRRELGIALEQPDGAWRRHGISPEGRRSACCDVGARATRRPALVIAGNDQHLAAYRRRAGAGARGRRCSPGRGRTSSACTRAADQFTLPSMFDAFGDGRARGARLRSARRRVRGDRRPEVLTGPLRRPPSCTTPATSASSPVWLRARAGPGARPARGRGAWVAEAAEYRALGRRHRARGAR